MTMWHTPVFHEGKRFLSAIAVAGLTTLATPAMASHLVNATLPDVGASFDGIPVATQYDDFYGYSTDLLDQLQTAGYMSPDYGDFSFSTGTGGLDVLLYTGSGGVHGGNDNQNVGPGGAYNFEDPVHNPNGSATSFEGCWGQSDQNCDGTPETGIHGPVTVGQVHDYLHAINPDNDIPVFYADLNQTGSGASAEFQVTINAMVIDTLGDLDPLNDVIVESWSMDAIDNGIYDAGVDDPNNYVDIPKDMSVTGSSGTSYDITFNRGSGSPDFAFYAPTMDLSLYSNDYLFVMEGEINNLNDGFEEFFLTGALVSGGIPLPATPWLLLGGLSALLPLRGLRSRS